MFMEISTSADVLWFTRKVAIENDRKTKVIARKRWEEKVAWAEKIKIERVKRKGKRKGKGADWKRSKRVRWNCDRRKTHRPEGIKNSKTHRSEGIKYRKTIRSEGIKHRKYRG